MMTAKKTQARKNLPLVCILMIIFLTGSGKADANSNNEASNEENNYKLEVCHILERLEADYYFEIAQTVENKLSEMTVHEKACQMIFADPENFVKSDAVTAMDEKLGNALTEYPVGGIMLKSKNIQNDEQLVKLIADMQDKSDIELFVAADEEGGKINRLMDKLGTTYIDSMYTYKDDGRDTAFTNAEIIGNDLMTYGFNLDFAPVADVWSNPDNTVIGERAYSDSFTDAAELVSYAVKGFHASGVMCTLKHFPGHGNTNEDSHYKMAYVYSTLDELRENEFLPFKAGIEAGADFVMVGHLVVTDVDEVPATMSKKIVTDVLRDELNFNGVIITDSFQMESITDNYGVAEATLAAINAGVDMILEPDSLTECADAIEDAVASGEIDEERLDESVRRILIMKVKNGLSV